MNLALLQHNNQDEYSKSLTDSSALKSIIQL